MLKPNTPMHHHAKIQLIPSPYGMANKIRKLDKKWCDTNCHTYIQQLISPKPGMIKSQTQSQNVH
jgi:hypothetical protein